MKDLKTQHITFKKRCHSPIIYDFKKSSEFGQY